jgi:hypothetical protein
MVSSKHHYGSIAKAMILSEDFEPSEYDVLCGRGHTYAARPGNVFYNKIVIEHIQAYMGASNRLEKSVVVVRVVRQILSTGARFVKMDKSTNRWYAMTSEQAHDKTGHAIRDVIRRQQKLSCSSTMASQAKMAMNKERSLAQKCLSYDDVVSSSAATIDDPPRTCLSEIQTWSYPNCAEDEGAVSDLESEFPETSYTFSPDFFHRHG